MHINVLETLSALNVVEALLPHGSSVAHFIDNTTAVAYIRNMGGPSPRVHVRRHSGTGTSSWELTPG